MCPEAASVHLNETWPRAFCIPATSCRANALITVILVLPNGLSTRAGKPRQPVQCRRCRCAAGPCRPLEARTGCLVALRRLLVELTKRTQPRAQPWRQEWCLAATSQWRFWQHFCWPPAVPLDACCSTSKRARTQARSLLRGGRVPAPAQSPPLRTCALLLLCTRVTLQQLIAFHCRCDCGGSGHERHSPCAQLDRCR